MSPVTDEQVTDPAGVLVEAISSGVAEARAAMKEAEAAITMYRAALADIAEGHGPYRRDPHAFACGVIENMKGIAMRALAGTYERQ